MERFQRLAKIRTEDPRVILNCPDCSFAETDKTVCRSQKILLAGKSKDNITFVIITFAISNISTGLVVKRNNPCTGRTYFSIINSIKVKKHTTFMIDNLLMLLL